MDGRRPRGVLIAASILDSDLGALGKEIRRADAAGVDRIHLDVMDGHFVPNLTFGWKMIEAVRRVTALPFDAHLMISEPGRWADRFLDAGCDSVTFHVEADTAANSRATLERIRAAGRSAGLSVKPGTPLSALDGYRDLLDVILVMTVEPGFGGQAFMRDVAEAKLAAARSWLDPAGACEVQVDGGGRAETAGIIGGGGTDVLVAGSALYRAADMAAEVARIRSIADAARATTLS